MKNTQIMEKLIRMLPYWHYKIERSIKQKHKQKPISFEAYFCLLALGKHGKMKMSEIADNLRISRQQATQLIEKLHKYDFIERIYDEKDRRSIYIAISSQGLDFLKENPFDVSLLQSQVEERLTQEEQYELEDALDVLLRLFPKLD